MKSNKFNVTPKIIDSTVDEEQVQYWCDCHNVLLQIVDDSSYWAGFSNKYGRENGLSINESGSFSYMVSMFIAGMGVSCGTDLYFRESDIEFKIWDILDELFRELDDEEEIAVKLFFEIFSLYKKDIEKYSLKNKSLVFRLSQKDYDNFMNVEGDSKVAKLRSLLNNYFQ